MQQYYIFIRNQANGLIIQFMMMMMKHGSLMKVTPYLMVYLLKFTKLYLMEHIFQKKLEHLFKKVVNIISKRKVLKLLDKSNKKNI
jgi:hypothetical protein